MEGVYYVGYPQVVATGVIPTVYTDPPRTWGQEGFKGLIFSYLDTSHRVQGISEVSEPNVVSECPTEELLKDESVPPTMPTMPTLSYNELTRRTTPLLTPGSLVEPTYSP